MAARLFGVLTFTDITVQFDRTPVRDAIAWLSRRLGVTVIGRYSTDPIGWGMDPSAPITLSAENRPALEVLEEMLSQCSAGGDECTWQIRKGFIEVGTKDRLSVPAARQRRTYYVADLIIDIPEDMRPGMDSERRRREVLALDVVADIVENIEPDAWDYGQDFEYEEPDVPPERLARDTAESGGGSSGENPDGSAAAPAPPPRRYVRPHKIALIRYWRDVLIIDAPDYIHRQIGGYPSPIRPGGERPSAP